MRRLLTAFSRLIAVIFGFIVAACAASLFFNILMLGALGWNDTAPILLQGPIYFSVAFLASFFGYHAFFPAIAAIVLAEALSRRDWLFHALAGAAVSVLAMGVSVGLSGKEPVLADTGLALIFVACGATGGIAYWLIAGRTSGRWLERS